MKTKTHNCPQCNKEIVLDEIKRIYGKESDVYKHKFCCAKCFTIYIIKDNQPQHTQGELTKEDFKKTIVRKFGADMVWSSDVAEACYKLHKNSKEVNMHDELIDALKEFIETSPCKNGCKKDDMTCLTNRSKALIKQAEQK